MSSIKARRLLDMALLCRESTHCRRSAATQNAADVKPFFRPQVLRALLNEDGANQWHAAKPRLK